MAAKPTIKPRCKPERLSRSIICYLSRQVKLTGQAWRKTLVINNKRKEWLASKPFFSFNPIVIK
jgi:hypothetical protein